MLGWLRYGFGLGLGLGLDTDDDGDEMFENTISRTLSLDQEIAR